MKRKIPLLIVFSAFLWLSCVPLLSGPSSHFRYLNQAAEKQLGNPNLKGSSWSVLAIDLQDGRVLLSQDADRNLIPASTVKLLVTACALETLGPDYRTSTLLGYSGSLSGEGTITGDLIVLGAGDPTFASRFQAADPSRESQTSSDVFSAWADSLAKHGIHGVVGDLIGYNGLFGGEALGSGWEWSDLPAWWAAEISPLAYGDNCVACTITPADSLGELAQVTINPANASLQINQQIQTVEPTATPRIFYDRNLGENRLTFWGTIPQGAEPEKRWISMHDPAEFFLTTLAGILREKGIEIQGSLRLASTGNPNDPGFTPLFADPSPPLSDLIQVINQHSQNLYSEMLIRLLGAQEKAKRAQPETTEADAFNTGRDCLRDWEIKLPGFATGYFLADGCGLSRRNVASAQEFVKVLNHMNRSPHREAFIASLPTPGVGTLENRFQGLPRGLTLRAKTGSLSRVRALSGYLVGEKGTPRVAFSFHCNNFLCPPEEIDQTMENLVQLLALYLKNETKTGKS